MSQPLIGDNSSSWQRAMAHDGNNKIEVVRKIPWPIRIHCKSVTDSHFGEVSGLNECENKVKGKCL